MLIPRDLDRSLADVREGPFFKKYSNVTLANIVPTFWKLACLRSPPRSSVLHTALPGLK